MDNVLSPGRADCSCRLPFGRRCAAQFSSLVDVRPCLPALGREALEKPCPGRAAMNQGRAWGLGPCGTAPGMDLRSSRPHLLRHMFNMASQRQGSRVCYNSAEAPDRSFAHLPCGQFAVIGSPLRTGAAEEDVPQDERIVMLLVPCTIKQCEFPGSGDAPQPVDGMLLVR